MLHRKRKISILEFVEEDDKTFPDTFPPPSKEAAPRSIPSRKSQWFIGIDLAVASVVIPR